LSDWVLTSLRRGSGIGLRKGRQTVKWNPEKLRRFWEFEYEVRLEAFFSRAHADALVKRIREASGRKKQKVLDLGCGTGDLVFALAKHYTDVFGADIESSRLEELKLKAASTTGVQFLGNSELADLEISFDIITSIETIEHLSDRELDDYIDQIKRLLKPDGLVFITTPNEENLEAGLVKCPDCSAVFHRTQHIRNWSADELFSFLRARGLEISTIGTTNFNRESRFGFLGRLMVGIQKLRKRKMPQLFGAARLTPS